MALRRKEKAVHVAVAVAVADDVYDHDHDHVYDVDVIVDVDVDGDVNGDGLKRSSPQEIHNGRKKRNPTRKRKTRSTALLGTGAAVALTPSSQLWK